MDVCRTHGLAVRDVVLEEAPQAIESISKGYALAIGYSFTGKPLKDGFCHIVTYSTHVNLGFNRGVLLPNPGHRSIAVLNRTQADSEKEARQLLSALHPQPAA